MGLLRERDCHQLGNAGHEARKRGILPKRESLTCSHMDCGQVNCMLVENPQFRTIYVASAETLMLTPQDKFYNRLQKHMNLVESLK